MTSTISEIVRSSFGSLAEKYALRQQNEVNDAQAYSIEYASTYFTVRLERYRVEFYATIYKAGHPDEQIALFNLLAYLAGPRRDCPVAEYFHNETSIEERYRKQLAHIAATLDLNFASINDFFRTGDYSSKIANVREFMVNRYPELFKKATSM